jgi:hypothetical protein
LAGLQTYGLLIRPAKTSYTAGTLYAIFSNILQESILQESIDKYKKICLDNNCSV